jgi:hypothetical protein
LDYPRARSLSIDEIVGTCAAAFGFRVELGTLGPQDFCNSAAAAVKDLRKNRWPEANVIKGLLFIWLIPQCQRATISKRF